MYKPLIRLYRYWRGDGSLTVAVVILIAFVFALYPMVEVGVVNRVWLDLTFAGFLIMGAIFVFEPRTIVYAFIACMVGGAAFSLIEMVEPARWALIGRLVTMLTASLMLGWLLLVRVMRDGRINLNRIMGAIGSYLLIGVMFSQAYRLLAAFIPDAFIVGGAVADPEFLQPRLAYFSFVTLTSTGYGDITPLHPYARSLATLEALSGNLFITVLIARLVALEVSTRAEEREQRMLDQIILPQDAAGKAGP